MTNEEAKAILKDHHIDGSTEMSYHPLFLEAIDVAIQALSDGWIRVEDKMPNYLENRDVITYSEKSYSKIDIQTVYRPAPISEEEIKGYLLSRCAYNNTECRKAIEWALSKQSRIVLPDDRKGVGMMVDYAHMNGWNACIESIRTLNPSAVFVTGQNEAK